MTVEFVTNKDAAGLTAYLFNQARKEVPHLKIGKARVVKDRLPISGIIISNETERGVVLKNREEIEILIM